MYLEFVASEVHFDDLPHRLLLVHMARLGQAQERREGLNNQLLDSVIAGLRPARIPSRSRRVGGPHRSPLSGWAALS